MSSTKDTKGKKPSPAAAAAPKPASTKAAAPKAAPAAAPKAPAAVPKAPAAAPKSALPEIKRNVRPDMTARDAEIAAVDAELKRIRDGQSQLISKFKTVRESSQGSNDERNKARGELRVVLEELKKKRTEQDAIVVELKAAQANIEAKIGEERKIKENLGKFSSAEAIEQEIIKIENMMTTKRVTVMEEKTYIRQIEKLRASKKQFGSVQQKTDEVAKTKDAKKAVEARLTLMRGTVDEVQRRFQEVKDRLTALETQDKEGPGAQLQDITQNRETLNAQYNALQKKRNDIWESFQNKTDEFKEAEKERRRLEDERRKAEDERRKVESEKRKADQDEYEKQQDDKRKAIEEEEMKQKPWEKEIELCDNLINYLSKVSGADQASAVTVPAVAAAPKKEVKTDFGTAKQFVRGQDQDYVPQQKKAVSSIAAIPVVSKPDSKVRLSLDLIENFASLSLSAPKSQGDIDASIVQLKEKRAYYDVLPRAQKSASKSAPKSKTPEPARVADAPAAVEEAVAEVAADDEQEPAAKAAKSESKKTKSSSRAPSVQDSSLFPQLPGAKTSTDVQKKWGPKAVDADASADDAPADEAPAVVEAEGEAVTSE